MRGEGRRNCFHLPAARYVVGHSEFLSVKVKKASRPVWTGLGQGLVDADSLKMRNQKRDDALLEGWSLFWPPPDQKLCMFTSCCMLLGFDAAFYLDYCPCPSVQLIEIYWLLLQSAVIGSSLSPFELVAIGPFSSGAIMSQTKHSTYWLAHQSQNALVLL